MCYICSFDTCASELFFCVIINAHWLTSGRLPAYGGVLPHVRRRNLINIYGPTRNVCGETHSFHNHLYGHYKLRFSATYISSWINYPLAYALSINHAVTHTSHTYNRQTDMHIHINSGPDDSRKINCVSGYFRFQVWASIYRASRRVRWPNGPDCDRATRYSRWTELRLRPSVMTRR